MTDGGGSLLPKTQGQRLLVRQADEHDDVLVDTLDAIDIRHDVADPRVQHAALPGKHGHTLDTRGRGLRAHADERDPGRRRRVG